jgi:hypothetical protein
MYVSSVCLVQTLSSAVALLSAHQPRSRDGASIHDAAF